MEGIILPILGLVGLIGNLLSILVLSAHEMTNSFNRLLIALAIFDSIFIIFVVLDYSFVRVWSWPFTGDSAMYAYIFPKILYPLNNISLCCSINTTILIAWERFTAVCNPYKYREKNANAKVMQ